MLSHVRLWISRVGGTKSIYPALISAYFPAIYSSNDVVRILDVGCGDGTLMCALIDAFPKDTSASIEVYGFEVYEHGARENPTAFRSALVSKLQKHEPTIAWESQFGVIC